MAFQKYTKADCDYGPGNWPEECGSCAHYSSPPTRRGYEKQGMCRIVSGRIEEEMLCKFHVYKNGEEPNE